MRIAGPGEVGVVTFASGAWVVCSLLRSEIDLGGARAVRAWVRIEVAGAAGGAWLARTRSGRARPSDRERPGGHAGDQAARSDDAAGGPPEQGEGPDTPAPPQGGNGTAAWLRAGLLRVRGPDPDDEDGEDHELARVSATAAGLLLRRWATGGDFAGAQAALA